MPSPIPNPEAPPPEPPIDLWTSTAIFAVGVAIGLYLVWTFWYASSHDPPEASPSEGNVSSETPPSEADDSDAPTEHTGSDVV